MSGLHAIPFHHGPGYSSRFTSQIEPDVMASGKRHHPDTNLACTSRVRSEVGDFHSLILISGRWHWEREDPNAYGSILKAIESILKKHPDISFPKRLQCFVSRESIFPQLYTHHWVLPREARIFGTCATSSILLAS